MVKNLEVNQTIVNCCRVVNLILQASLDQLDFPLTAHVDVDCAQHVLSTMLANLQEIMLTWLPTIIYAPIPAPPFTIAFKQFGHLYFLTFINVYLAIAAKMLFLGLLVIKLQVTTN